MKRLNLIGILFVLAVEVYGQQDFYYTTNNQRIPITPILNKIVLKKKTTVSASTFERMCKQSHLDIISAEWDRDSTRIYLTLASNVKLTDLRINSDLCSSKLYKYKIENTEVEVNNEIIAKLKNKDISLIEKTIKYGITEYRQTYSGDYIITLKEGANPISYANSLYETGNFEYVFPCIFCEYEELAFIPNDQYFSMQYALHNTGQTFTDSHSGTVDADINAPEAWDITMGSQNIIVAVIDGGVTSNHPDLPNSRQLRLDGSNFGSGNPNDPSPIGNNAHGTSCAGAIAASINNNEGIAGIAPLCKIMPIRVENGTSVPVSAQIANAFAFAVNNGAKIISCSLGFSDYYNQPNIFPDIVDKISMAINNGVCVMLAAGNWEEANSTKVAFPANCNVDYKIAVGASDRYDMRAYYSPINAKIDIVAPSHRAYSSQITTENFEVWALDIPGYYGYNPDKNSGEYLPNSGINYLAYTGRFGGTSYSAPLIAGTAALMLSVNANLTPQEVYSILTQTADKVGGYSYVNGRCNEMGYGRVDAYAAVLAAKNKYIQNTTYISGSSVVEYYPEIYAGYSVTDAAPYGNVIVKSGSNVTYKATNKIHLKQGFRVEQGATFHAYIETPATIMSSPTHTRRNIKSEDGEDTIGNKDANTEMLNDKMLYVTPNPVKDILYITTKEDIANINIYDIGGHIVLHTSDMNINVSHLPMGMYIVQVEAKSGEQLHNKFIKQ